jgi:membrane-bound metal-dependent hydrolase YbcI (DUF457 family)
MDILTHICSGVAGATVIAVFAKKQRVAVLLSGAIGGALPDIDAISMWSKFDATFGRLFGLAYNGKMIYGGKFWYSHHAFFHSIVAALLIALLFGLLCYSIYRLIHKKTGYAFLKYWKNNILLAIAFIAGYLLHLFGDMPTPASVWGGVNLFFPNDAYIGGSGKIWWWNNYDIFLLLALCISINCVILVVFKQRVKQIAVVLLAVFTFALIEVQINTRRYNYAYSGNAHNYAEMEQHAKAEQKRILGERIYSAMEWLDNRLPINF